MTTAHKLSVGFALLCCAGMVHAGWLFGPSTVEECQAEYAPKAKTQKLVRIAYWACGRTFDRTLHKSVRNSAECVLDRVDEMGNEASFPAVRTKCDIDNGVVQCAYPNYSNDKTNRCERMAGT